MSFFGRKKPKVPSENKEIEDLPELPKFPTSDDDLKFPEFPSYESSEINPVKEFDETISLPKIDLPRAEDFVPKRKKIPERVPEFNIPQEEFVPREEFKPRQEEFRRTSFEEGKPLFIKIEDYEDAINTIDKIKLRLQDADKLLAEISRIRKQEDSELENWNRDLENVKEKLLMVDKQLFET